MHLICIAVASFAVLAQPAGAQGTNTTLPLIYSTQVFQDGNQTCLSEEQRETARIWVKNAAKRLLQQSVVSLPQTFSCGGSTSWRRVAYLNMSDPSEHCPSVWLEITTPHRVCGRNSTTSSCEGLNYTTGSEQYDQVCGRIIGYHKGQPEGFHAASQSINTSYVDGISVTRGSPRQHIWTFASGYDEQPGHPTGTCPCVAGSTSENNIPSFVGQNYFCESGVTEWPGHLGFHPDSDPLWDGQGCGPTSSCCTFHSPPWFNVPLPSPTTDDIEVRICTTRGTSYEDSPIQFLELYVK